MMCHVRPHVLVSIVVLVLALCQVSKSAKPHISPNKEEIVINEGDPLKIQCVGTSKIKFTYPDIHSETINTSDAKTSFVEAEVFRHTFERNNTVFGDTGWYGCAYEDIKIEPNSYDNPEVAWIYVYVKSNTHFFVETDVTVVSLNAIAGTDIVLPCRLTSPDLNITLEVNEEDILPRATFDPRVGFTIKNLLVKDSDWLKCVVREGDEEQNIIYVLAVHLKQELSAPIIHDDDHLHHVTRGQDLHINCSVIVDAATRYVFNWTTPQEDSKRISIQQFRRIYGGNNFLVTCQLRILNITDEDAGAYVCSIRSISDYKNVTKTIMVYDPEIKYINLTAQHYERYYQGKSNGKVQWVVYIDGYPKPVIQWFNPSGKEITNSTKYFVNISSSSTMLMIRTLNVLDTGIYTLEAKNNYTIERMNFTLDVSAKPITMLSQIEPYYAPNQTVELQCDVASSSLPEVTWSFLKCPKYPSYKNSTVVELKSVVENTTSMIRFVSRAKMSIEMSGHLTCKACNGLDCDTANETIFVSDGLGAFGIIGPELVTKGDNVELICAASVYNYTDDLTWKNQSDAPIKETDRIQIIRRETPFTYRSILKISNVQETDDQFYTCVGMFTMQEETDLPDITSYKMTVHAPVLPFFKLTNMNETNVRTIEETEEGHKILPLQCFAGGMPVPTVTWYKDDILLKENEQYFFMHNNQELNIKYMSQQDSGIYTCRAKNRLAVKETYQQITVMNGRRQKLDIILAVSIAILGAFLIILAIVFIIKVRREKKMRKELMEAGLMHFEEGALECLNPDLTVDDQAELLPYDKKWEFPRERLKLGKQLGSGAFGVVIKAEAQGICEDETITTVAVKMVRRTTDPTYVRALASELKIMVHLGKHLNVVNLLGACTKNISKRELLVIVEYCRFGNLHNYLLRHRTNFVNQINDKTGKLDLTIGMDELTRTVSVSSNNSLSANSGTDPMLVRYNAGVNSDCQEVNFATEDVCVLSNNSSQPGWRSNYRGDYKDHNLKPICTQDLLSWAFQVARGMEYLCQRRVLHGDLAARNILLAEDNVVKICDFGLAKTMYKDGNYKKKGDGPLPIKWMAIESIRDRIFSTQSDIWSFGIVLWEFFTLAETPYPGMEAEKQYQKLIEGYRMEKPEYAIREVYDIMLQCWKAKPTLRPSFNDLVNSIGDLLEETVKSHYISLNTPYMDMNTTILESGKNDYLTMMSAPDHAALSSPTAGHEYVNAPFPSGNPDSVYLCMNPGSETDESGIFSPRPHQNRSCFEFPLPMSDSEDAVEISPMLKHEEDPYLKPINVQERRAEFVKQRQLTKDHVTDKSPMNDRDSGYCNTPRNLHLIDLNDVDEKDTSKREEESEKTEPRKKDYAASIISTQDNYVNMPKQKSDLRKGMPDSFSNPSYVMMNNQMDQKV